MQQLSYIPFGNRTITIYNQYKYKNASGKTMTKWIRRVVPNCSIEDTGGIVKLGTTTITTDSTNVKIPLFREFKQYYDWINIVNDEQSSYFTANEGDLVVMREVTDEVVEDIGIIEDIEQKYGSLAFRITSVHINYGEGIPMPHVEVVSA